MKIFYMSLIVSLFILTGCHHDVKPPRECPTFDAKLSILVGEYNSTHSVMSWEDISNIETFLKQKKVFNEGVKRINDDL